MQLAPPRAHINVTPMIDVMLVLLIIFMVVIPVIATQIDLPLATNVPSKPEEPDEIVLILDHRGDAYLEVDGHAAPGIALREQLAALYRDRVRDRRLYLKADSSLSYGVLEAIGGGAGCGGACRGGDYRAEDRAADVIRALTACPERSDGRRLGEGASRTNISASSRAAFCITRRAQARGADVVSACLRRS